MHKGFGIIEIIIGAAIILVVALTCSNAVVQFLQNSKVIMDSLAATYSLEEEVEAVRFLRDQSYTGNIASLSPETKYYLNFGGSWATSTERILYDGRFERYITAESIYRDASGRIVSAGGVLDPDTKKINAVVEWNSGRGTTTRALSVYVANIFSN